MALPTYLELVNDVLVRLREPEVTTVNENNLSRVVGKFINDGKRQVEDAYRWNALKNTLTVSTSNGTYNYSVTGIGQRFKVIDVYNVTDKKHLENASADYMTDLIEGSGNAGAPYFYNFNGVDTNGDTKVDLAPIPNGVFSIKFNVYLPQDNLRLDADTLKIPAEPVTAWALARSLVERGEDGGLQSSEAYALFKQVLADYIDIERGRYVEEEGWRVI